MTFLRDKLEGPGGSTDDTDSTTLSSDRKLRSAAREIEEEEDEKDEEPVRSSDRKLRNAADKEDERQSARRSDMDLFDAAEDTEPVDDEPSETDDSAGVVDDATDKLDSFLDPGDGGSTGREWMRDSSILFQKYKERADADTDEEAAAQLQEDIEEIRGEGRDAIEGTPADNKLTDAGIWLGDALISEPVKSGAQVATGVDVDEGEINDPDKWDYAEVGLTATGVGKGGSLVGKGAKAASKKGAPLIKRLSGAADDASTNLPARWQGAAQTAGREAGDTSASIWQRLRGGSPPGDVVGVAGIGTAAVATENAGLDVFGSGGETTLGDDDGDDTDGDSADGDSDGTGSGVGVVATAGGGRGGQFDDESPGEVVVESDDGEVVTIRDDALDSMLDPFRSDETRKGDLVAEDGTSLSDLLGAVVNEGNPMDLVSEAESGSDTDTEWGALDDADELADGWTLAFQDSASGDRRRWFVIRVVNGGLQALQSSGEAYKTKPEDELRQLPNFTTESDAREAHAKWVDANPDEGDGDDEADGWSDWRRLREAGDWTLWGREHADGERVEFLLAATNDGDAIYLGPNGRVRGDPHEFTSMDAVRNALDAFRQRDADGDVDRGPNGGSPSRSDIEDDTDDGGESDLAAPLAAIVGLGKATVRAVGGPRNAAIGGGAIAYYASNEGYIDL